MPKKILIVDDETEVLQLLEKKLVTSGYTVVKTDSGREAILMAKTQKPDLILLDIMMPNMDGPEIAAALREDPVTADTPVLFLSGIVTKEDENDPQGGVTIKGRPYKVISKPFNFAELLTEVKKILEV